MYVPMYPSCGTGLGAVAFAGLFSSIVGVDLSPEMAAKAREKNMYARVDVCDIVEWTTHHAAVDDLRFDIAIATDVFVYIGDLTPVLLSVASCLIPAGLFAFSVESSPTFGYSLNPSGRFAHSHGYVEASALAAGFVVQFHNVCEIRKNAGVPVIGGLYVCRKSP